MAIPEGGVGEINHQAATTGDNQNVASIICVWRETDNHWLAMIRTIDDVIECPAISPGRLKAKLRSSILDTSRSRQTQSMSNLFYLRSDLQHINDAVMTTIGMKDLRYPPQVDGR